MFQRRIFTIVGGLGLMLASFYSSRLETGSSMRSTLIASCFGSVMKVTRTEPFTSEDPKIVGVG